MYNVRFEVYVESAKLLPCVVAPTAENPYMKEPSGCFGNGMLDIHDGTQCDLADYDAFEAGGVDAGVAPGACYAEADRITSDPPPERVGQGLGEARIRDAG